MNTDNVKFNNNEENSRLLFNHILQETYRLYQWSFHTGQGCMSYEQIHHLKHDLIPLVKKVTGRSLTEVMNEVKECINE